MRVVDVKNNKELLQCMEQLQNATMRFLSSKESRIENVEYVVVNLQSDLEFGEEMCKRLKNIFRYFRGEFNGNGHRIIVASPYPVILFSSIYQAQIRDLNIHNVPGSNGLLLCNDAVNSFITNVNLTGTVSLIEPTGGLVKTATGCTFSKCRVNLQTRCENTAEGGNSEDPIAFGSYTYHALKGTLFKECIISGSINAEVKVGGLSAIATECSAINCSADKLVIKANREVGLFFGKTENSVLIEDCVSRKSFIYGTIYVGSAVGLSSGELNITKLNVHEVVLAPKGVSQFVGGILGSGDSLAISESSINIAITANFIVAGIVSDIENLKISKTELQGTLVCLTYYPMTNHAYELAKHDKLSSKRKEIEITTIDVTNTLILREASVGGNYSPFEDGVL